MVSMALIVELPVGVVLQPEGVVACIDVLFDARLAGFFASPQGFSCREPLHLTLLGLVLACRSFSDAVILARRALFVL